MKFDPQGRYGAIAATVAVVIALGGTSYGAMVITGADIKNGTVSTRDVRDKTLELKDFSPKARMGLQGATGPAGATGAAGPQGIPGPAGSSMLYVRRVLSTSTSGGEYVPATCPQGSTPVTLFVPAYDFISPPVPLPAGVNFGSNYMQLDLEHNAILVEIFANNPPTPSTRDVVVVCFAG